MLYIGVDLGTSAVKLLLMSADGKIENIVSKEYPLEFPHPGWSQQKPEDWWEAVMTGLKELTANADKSQIAGISFGGQMHGLVVLDKDDNVLRPAILWNDGRTTKETDYLNTVIGKDKLSEYTANIAFAGFTAPKILWMKENEPELFAKIAKIMLPKDYIAYKLSGVHCTDVSDASGMLLFDVKNKCWSKEMMDICSVREDQLAKIFESYEVVGNILPDIAKELGFSESVKIIAGAGDNAAAAVLCVSSLTAEKRRAALLAMLLICTVFTVSLTGPKASRYVERYIRRAGMYEATEAALDTIPDDASVTAYGFLMPHIAYIDELHTCPDYYGDYGRTEYYAVDTRYESDEHTAKMYRTMGDDYELVTEGGYAKIYRLKDIDR